MTLSENRPFSHCIVGGAAATRLAEAVAVTLAAAPVVFVLVSAIVGLSSYHPVSALILAAREPGVLTPAAGGPGYYITRVNGSLVVIVEGNDLGSLGNTLGVSVIASLVATLVAAAATGIAYLYSSARVLWRLLIAVSLPSFPFVEAYVAQRLMSIDYGVPALLVSHHVPIVVVPRGLSGVAVYEAVAYIPYAAAIIGGYMFSLPREEIEAAIQLGARGPRLVMLLSRLSSPAVMTALAFGAVYIMDDVSGPFVFARDPLARSLLSYRAYTYFLSAATGYVNLQGIGYALLLLLASAPFIAASVVLYKRMSRETLTGISSPPLRGGLAAAALMAFLLLPSAGLRVASMLYAFTDTWLRGLFPHLGLRPWHMLLTHPDMLRGSINSAVYATLTLAAMLALVAWAAWWSQRGRGSTALGLLFTLPVLLPGIAVAYGLYLLYAGRGGLLDPLANPVPLLLLGYYARRSPLLFHAASALARSVPASLEEAAVSLGAHPLQGYLAAVAPLLLRRLSAAAVYTALSVAGEVSLSVTLGGLRGAEGFSHPAPLMYLVASYMGYSGLKYAPLSAAATLVSYALSSAAVYMVLWLYLLIARKSYR